MKPVFSLHQCDFYKVGHVFQYPEKTTLVYSNLTPRSSRIPGVNKVIFVGLIYFIKEYLIRQFNETFFKLPKEEAIRKYRRRMKSSLFSDLQTYEHLAALHDLQYIPLSIKAVPEGTFVDIKVPCMTVVNTKDEFYWLPNFIETILSTSIWQTITSATLANQYKNLLVEFARKTVTKDGDISFVNWQGHDFSERGMSSFESACMSGFGHLTSFWGTDTIGAIDFAEEYYNANSDTELVGGSVPATEHSVMCAGGKEDEDKTIDRIIFDVYPSGIVSVVSDTYDYWRIINEYAPSRKDKILARTGAAINKVVFRPDSGTPCHIIAGYRDSEVSIIGAGKYVVVSGKDTGKVISEVERQGSVEVLWEHFGGTITEQGYKLLNSQIGLIYGDSITVDVCKDILERLEEKGFASFNIVFGIGSFTYQYNTRDTFGFAMKATFVEIDGVGREIFKDPVTDNGVKKSAKGLLRVDRVDGSGTDYDLKLVDQVSWDEEKKGYLQEVFRDGKILRDESLSAIRSRLNF